MLGRLQVCGGAGNSLRHLRQKSTDLAPGKKSTFQKCQQEAEQECGNTDRDNSGIHAIEIQHFARGLHHVADALAGVHHLGQDHVRPADVVEDAE